ncbi:MAG: 4Fe-4S dicluster domain-containing protein [Natrialbaceae archaeon]|nr:4Fe-4S dicluster domain-containing protein [Natrialbaceae archaeon]
MCTGCGICVEKCPRKIADTEFEAGMGTRKAIYMPFPQAVPRVPVLDTESCIRFERQKCGACQKLCPTDAIKFDQEDETLEMNVGNIIIATGWKPFDCREIPQYGYGRLANVYTSLEFERLCNAAGPTSGNIVLRDGKTVPKSVAIIHCVGSRDLNAQRTLLGVLLHGRVEDGPPGDGEDGCPGDLLLHRHPHQPERLRRVLTSGYWPKACILSAAKFRKSPTAARLPEEHGKLIVQAEDTLFGKQRRIPVDMVILMGAIEPQEDAKEVGLKCGISCSIAGFYTERHPKLDPVATATDGIFGGRCLPGSEGHSRLGGAGCRRGCTRVRDDHQGQGDD